MNTILQAQTQVDLNSSRSKYRIFQDIDGSLHKAIAIGATQGLPHIMCIFSLNMNRYFDTGSVYR